MTTTEDLLRALSPQVLGVLARRVGSFPEAEDAVQEALLAAAGSWPADGVPDDPAAWLHQVAFRRFVDAYRSDRARHRRELVAATWSSAAPPSVESTDDTLTCMYLCAHPVLPPSLAIPLTLRAVGGLTTAEIAAAFFLPVPTMGQRISRAKAKLRAENAPFAPPPGIELPHRLRLVLRVLYLIFNEGYAATAGNEVARTALSDRAIALTRLLQTAQPDHTDVAGLLALMLLTDARRPARTNDAGDIVPLAEQDRERWDRGTITEGLGILTAAMRRGPLGEYGLQACIAALHNEAHTAEATRWTEIAALYGRLERLTGNRWCGSTAPSRSAWLAHRRPASTYSTGSTRRWPDTIECPPSARTCWNSRAGPRRRLTSIASPRRGRGTPESATTWCCARRISPPRR